jgi:hypothetical protein
MQITINVPDTLLQEFLKQHIQEIEQSFITEAQFFTGYQNPSQETLLAIEAVERGEVEKTSLEELRLLRMLYQT